MDRTEAMICQHLYWPDIIYAVQREVTNCDTYKRTKQPNNKYGKLPAKLAEEIPRNIICVYTTGPYVIRRKGHEENLHLRAVTIIDPLTG